MCLDKLLPMPEKFTKEEEFIGYKVLCKGEDSAVTPIYRTMLKYNEWNIDDEPYSYYKLTCILSSDLYTTGYHLFLSHNDASIWMDQECRGIPLIKIFTVRFANVVAYGLRNNIPVMVARKIYIDKEELI
jgi:hypothetical protein